MNAHHNSQMFKFTLAVAACFSLTMGPVTFAQNGLQLEEVLVTAQKREENLQDIAVSVTSPASSYYANWFRRACLFNHYLI